MSAVGASPGEEQPGLLGNPFFEGLDSERTAGAQGVVTELLRESGVVARVNVPRY